MTKIHIIFKLLEKAQAQIKIYTVNRSVFLYDKIKRLDFE